MVNEMLQGEIMAEAQTLESQFITTHQALVALKSNPCASPGDLALKRLLVSYLEVTEDRVVTALDELILRAKGDPAEAAAPCGMHLRVVEKDAGG